MLEKIHLQNFKVSKDVTLSLAPLTVLAGLNGAGKSTSLQALALLRQSYERIGHLGILYLSGHLVRLGEGEDVLSETATSDELIIEVTENGRTYRWNYHVNPADRQLYVPQPQERHGDHDHIPIPAFLRDQHFQFLQADRITPKTLYPQTDVRNEFLGVGGEYTVDFLARNGEEMTVSAARRANLSGLFPNEFLDKIASTPKLTDQVAAWLQFLSPGVRLKPARVKGTDEVQLQFNYSSHTQDLDQDRRPVNVGFGLTYSLPIIVACLAAPKGSLLLLENPEAHLHPQGQAALGELLARCAADGVQIIVETHSDHLLNGIRLAAKQSLIQADQVAMHFFTRSYESGDASVQSPQVLPNGRLTAWPDGFFDQWDKSLDALLDD
jgi:predicted ATPase